MLVLFRRPEEMGFSEDMKLRVVEMIEGSECAPFWLVLGSSSRAHYHSLVGGPYLSLSLSLPLCVCVLQSTISDFLVRYVNVNVNQNF